MLAQGLHPIKVTYLYDDLPADNFRIEWESADKPRQPIGVESLRTISKSTQPISKIEAISLGEGAGESVSPFKTKASRSIARNSSWAICC